MVLRALTLCSWVAALLLTAGSLSAQISPGPLSRAHQDLEGSSKCTSCHVFGLGQRALKCLDCHTEIARRVTAKTGYHAANYKATNNQLDCARCHAEHNGKQFQLTKFDRTKFDHAKMAGFELVGKHASLKCESCHTPAHITVQPGEIRMKDKTKTFLGMGRECTQCHQDPHKAEFGSECTTCHSQNQWKPAESFNHSKTSYPLTGRHANASCSGCHKPTVAGGMPQFRNLRYSSCDNCHTDPHKGSFEAASFQGGCSNCHVTAGWKSLKTDADFNHSRTKFPLLGKHKDVTCFKCHTGSDFSKPVAHALCADCHQDVHKGQFTGRAAGSDCAACHTEQQFKPSLYTLDQHQQAFRLEGKHEAATCASCHKPAGPDTKYKLGTTTCQSCHADPHGKEFAAQPHANQCETCHTQSAFHPSTFTPARHAQTKFVLTGAHRATLCNDCHQPMRGATTNAERQYHFAAQNCTACHTDPHQTRETCETCHNTAQWSSLRVFDHNATKFKLEGAHQAATCVGCHRSQSTEVASKAKASPNFAKTPTVCHECHEDIHAGQFMQPGQEQECASCHTVTNWNSRSFDHNKTRFSLEGAHAEVRCAQCHMQTLKVDGREARLYRGAPLECKACHSDGTAGGKVIAQ